MNKREVTEAMVERARNELRKNYYINQWGEAAAMKAALEAALNPPPEPEIRVSEGMIEAGRCVTNRSPNIKPVNVGYQADRDLNGLVAVIYRAMESQRRKEEGNVGKGPRLGARVINDALGWAHRRVADPLGNRYHRRSTDPK